MQSDFEGECYDGPWAGRHVKRDSPYFAVAFSPPLAWAQPWEEIAVDAVVHQGFYRWSHPLKKWVFDDHGTSVKYAYGHMS